MENKPRKSWLDGLLTFCAIGLGHLYYGDIKKGVILFLGGQVFLILAFSSFLFYAPVGPIITIIAGISYLVYCIVDSVKGAKAYKHSYSMKKYNRGKNGVKSRIVNKNILNNISSKLKSDLHSNLWELPGSFGWKPARSRARYLLIKKQ